MSGVGVARARLAALPANAQGTLWMLVAGLCFSAMAALAKLLGARLDSFEIAFFRCLVGLLAVLPFALHRGFVATLRTAQPGLHVLRSLVGVTAMFCGFYAFTRLPLADATALSFTKPLFVIVLAVLLLGEPVHWRRWTATGFGFLGVLIMLRPGQRGLDPAALAALGGALCVALAVMCVKKLAAAETTLTMMLYFALISTAVAAGPAALVWRAPTPEELVLLGCMGLLGVTGQVCIVRAYRVGEATAVAPFDYARLLFAAGFGFALFGDVPDRWTVAGALVIVASTLYIARREARLGKLKDAEAVARQQAQRAT